MKGGSNLRASWRGTLWGHGPYNWIETSQIKTVRHGAQLEFQLMTPPFVKKVSEEAPGRDAQQVGKQEGKLTEELLLF